MPKSPPDRAESVQNRSGEDAAGVDLPVVHRPVGLPAGLPCVGGGIFVQGDKPISHLHLHDCVELGYCHEGAGVFMVGRKVLRFQAGDVSVINEHEMHLARSVEGTTSLWTWIYFDAPRLVGPAAGDLTRLDCSALCGDGFRNIIAPADDAGLGPLVRILIGELDHRPAGWQSAIRALVWSIVCRLHRLPGIHRAGHSVTARSTSAIERVAPALNSILNAYHRDLEMTELADACHMSPATFRRVFHDATGLPPMAYLIRVRIQMAKAMLTDDSHAIGEVALQTGHATLSSFNRHFRRLTGVSPRQWRAARTT